MTQFFQFQPSNRAPFQFQPVLDGATYNAAVPWVLFGAGFYLDLRASDGTPLVYQRIAGSPAALQIEALSWANGVATAQTSLPHGYRVASSVALNVQGCAPAGFNGQPVVMSTGPDTFSWRLPLDPGPATVFGSASQDVNLVGGFANENGVYFTSRLVFRTGTQQFEASP